MSTTIDANVIIPNQSHLVAPSEAPNDCFIDKKNLTLVFTNAYNGVPDNLLINAVAFILLVLLFGILRKKAWNYGRLALLHKTENRWMELFYGDNDTREAEVTCIEACVNSQLSHTDRGFLSWILTAFKLPDEELLKRAGPDGLLYISFQRHLMTLTAMMTVTSLLIILPINSTGDPVDKPSNAFTHTTLENLKTNSPLLWIHTIILLSYLPIGAYIMRHYIRRVRDTKPAGELAARTLLITEIPKHQCTVEGLTEYFKEAFPTLSIEDVTLAYDVRELSRLDAERDCAEQARLYCENYNRRKGPLRLYPHPCGRIVGCCLKQKQVDALEFYTGEEARLAALVEEERKIALSRPIGVAFVTLGTPGAARTMRRQLRSSPSIQWIVDYAPAPVDIYWENLSIARPCWYLTWITSNCILALVLFFLTAPAVILSRLTLIALLTNEVKKWSPMVSTLLPSVILVSVTALMPAMVGRIEMLVRHWTRSGMNRAVMRKTLLLLLLMVLIFPSIGQPSVDVMLKNFISDVPIKWTCIFLPDRGALFVNYVITAALLGSGLELVRFPELALYTFRLCTARSRAERIYVRKAVLWEYPLGAHYAWLLLVFTMTTVYSLACPLITPFALMYLSIKHLVDRHNLCFAYGPSVGGGQLASAAANYTGIAPILAQLAFLALGLARSTLSAITAVQLCGLAASILGLVTGVTLPASKPKTQSSKRDFSAGQHFVAPVLRKKLNTGSPEETVSLSTTAQSSPSTKVYTTSSSTQGSPKLYQNYNTEPTNV